MSDFEKRIEVIPAFDRRSKDPKKDYGIHNAELKFFLIGSKGAIQFVVSTGWHLPHVLEETFERWKHNPDMLKTFTKAWATDIGYHSPKPMYEDQNPLTDDCPIIKGRCYYDGSTLNAEPIFNRMVAEGHEAVWEEMMSWYTDKLEAQP